VLDNKVKTYKIRTRNSVKVNAVYRIWQFLTANGSFLSLNVSLGRELSFILSIYAPTSIRLISLSW
jgi:hypothetical protein